MSEQQPQRREAAMRSNYEREDNLSARQSIFAYARMVPGEPRLSDLLRLSSGRQVLDVGCGNGLWLDEVMKHSSPSRAVGVDLSMGMVQAAHARCPDAFVALVDAVALPFADGQFDALMALWMLYHVPDKQRALSEFRRVLGRGGRLFAATNAPGFDSPFDDLVRGAIESTTGAIVDGWLEPLDFDADNGHDVLAPHFDRVERHVMHREFVVPQAAPLVAYVASLRAPVEAQVGVLPWTAFLDALEQGIEARLRSGPVTYRTAQCLFICS